MKTYNPSLWIRGTKSALIQARDIAEPKLVGVIADFQTSESNFNQYPWIGEAPIMKLLKDELEAAQLSDAILTLTNATYGIALEIGRDDLHDDQLGAQMMRARQAGMVALNFANRLIALAIEAGTTAAGFDGVATFHDAHPIRGQQTATQDNLLTGTGVTVAALKADLASSIAAAMNWKAENGEPLAGTRTNWVMFVPPALLFNAQEAVYAQIISQTSNQAFRGMTIEVMASPRLTDANDWYLFDAGPVKPFIYQEARPVSVEFLGEGSDYYVTKEKALIKYSWRGVVGPNHPGLSFKVVN